MRRAKTGLPFHGLKPVANQYCRAATVMFEGIVVFEFTNEQGLFIEATGLVRFGPAVASIANRSASDRRTSINNRSNNYPLSNRSRFPKLIR